MYRLFLILFSILTFSSVKSQDYMSIMKSQEAEKNYEYAKAIKYLKKALKFDSANQYLHYKIGKNYYYQNKYEDALSHYEAARVLMKDSMKFQFELFHLYSVAGYDVFAKEAFVKYVYLCPSCVKGDLLPGNNANKLMYRKPIKQAELLGEETRKASYYPYIINETQVQVLNTSPDRSEPTNPLHFADYLTTTFTNHDFMFYDGDQYSQINRSNGDKYGPFTLNNTKSKIYTTRWDRDLERMFIYFSKRDTNGGDYAWERFQPIKVDIDKNNASFIHPMLSKDEKHLIFASNQPGGLGGYDLWIGEIANDLTIKNVKNLGTYVNTPGDECFPSVHDEDVLFFASNGHYGFGNLDLYAGVKARSGKIKKTYNLGNRFNSINDDYALFYNTKKNTAFFTSNRFKNSSDSMPFDRIYKQSFDKVSTTIEIVESSSNLPVSGAQITIPSENIKKTTDSKGKLVANMNPLGYKKIVVTGDKYAPIDTVMSPFESKILLAVTRIEPKDNVTFSLLSTPMENAMANTYYKLSNLNDGKVYTGYSNETGLVNLTLYKDDEYQLDVPQYNFSKNSIKFDEMIVPKFYVKNDNIPAKKSTTSSNPVLTDNLTLYYETSKWIITEKEESQIQHIVAMVASNPSYKLELNSYTDCQGDVASNLELSKQRLAEAKKFFFSRGVPENQIIGKYHGEAGMMNSCKCDDADNYNCPSDEMKKNRRTEVKVVK